MIAKTALTAAKLAIGTKRFRSRPNRQVVNETGILYRVERGLFSVGELVSEVKRCVRPIPQSSGAPFAFGHCMRESDPPATQSRRIVVLDIETRNWQVILT